MIDEALPRSLIEECEKVLMFFVDGISALKQHQSALHERVVRLETTASRNHVEVIAAIAVKRMGGQPSQGAPCPRTSRSQAREAQEQVRPLRDHSLRQRRRLCGRVQASVGM